MITEKEKNGLFTRLQDAWLALKDRAGFSSYEEIWREASSEHPLPIKENYKNGRLTGRSYTVCLPPNDNFLDERYLPSFVVGRCRIIGEGDYKVVFADHDGQSDTVIKSAYGYFRGEHGEEKAEIAAYKLGQIYEIASQIVPGVVLPAEWIIEEEEEGYKVYERQQRALPVPIDLLNPRMADRLNREANFIALTATDRLKRELLKRGLSRKDPYFNRFKIADQLDLTEIQYDLITEHLVSLDVVDRLDIVPLLPPHIKPIENDFG